jgi:hypothetical protein
MPTPGKSLFGFLDQPRAISYVQNACVVPDPTDIAQMQQMWVQARAQLGPPVTNAGHPDIQPIPNSHSSHVQSLQSAQWIIERGLGGWQYALVEIDPLIAYQHSIGLDRSAHHCAPFGSPPTLGELLNACLPIIPPLDPYHVVPAEQSLLITSKSLNMMGLAKGLVAQNFAGVVFGPAIPLAHVVRFNGRCYLHNGFHRAYGARLAGATHIPCVLRDVGTAAEAGIRADGGTFDQSLVESQDPPTLAHYCRGSAVDVQLRVFTRTLHVSWAEYAVPAE